MPNVPVYQKQTQINTRLNAPQQSINAPIEAFGGGKGALAAGDALGKAGTALSGVVVGEKNLAEKKGKAWADATAAKLQSWFNDPENGYYKQTLQRVGESANGLTKEAREAYDTKVAELMGDAPNQYAREQFSAKALALHSRDISAVAKHEANELNKWAVTSKKSLVEGNLRTIITQASSFAKIDEVDEQFSALVDSGDLEELAAMTGAPVSELRTAVKAKMYESVINQALANNTPERARAMLEKWGDKLDPNAAAKATKTIRGAEDEAAAADATLAAARGDIGGARAAARGVQDKSTRAKLEAKIVKLETDLWADESAGLLIAEVAAGNKSEAEIKEFISNMKNPVRKSALDSAFRARITQHKIIERENKLDAVDNLFTQISGVATDPVAAQKMLRDMEASQDTEQGRYLYTKAKAPLENIIRSAGVNPRDDVTTHVDLQDKIDRGEITDPRELREAALGKLIPQTVDRMVKDMQTKQVVRAADLKSAFLSLVEANDVSQLSDSEKKKWLAFREAATERAKETNKGQDENWLRRLAASMLVEGETDPDAVFFTGDKDFHKIYSKITGARQGSSAWKDAMDEWNNFLPTWDTTPTDMQNQIESHWAQSADLRQKLLTLIDAKGYKGSDVERAEYAKRLLYKQVMAKQFGLPAAFITQ
jgi:hypothetical protein